MTPGPSRRAVLVSALAWSASCKREGPVERRAEGEPRSSAGGEPDRPLTQRAPSVSTASASAEDATATFVKDAGPPFELIDLVFATSAVGPEKALAIVPRWGEPGARYPVLVALHGRGEAVRGIDVGARAWLHDYDLGHAIARLREPPLTREDFKGFVDEARLARLNASLAARPFRGLVVVCPWVPDLVNEKDRANLDAPLAFGRFVVDDLLPGSWAATPALRDRRATGIDGVSLGGRASLIVGLAHPDRFGAVGALQPAIQESEAGPLAERASRAVAGSDGLRIRLVTSDRDYFRGPVLGLHLALGAEHVEHEHLVIPGPHDYAFNRGPGGLEMLLWHDRVLRGEPPL